MKCKTHRENAPLELGEELQSDRDMVTKTREEQRSSRDTKLECKIQRSEGNLANKHATDRNWAGQRTEPDNMDAADREEILKLEAMAIETRSDMDKVVGDWEGYIQNFEDYLHSVKRVGAHKNPEKIGAPCDACMKSKELLKSIGGSEAKTMLDYVGEVEMMDRWQETLHKVRRGIQRYSSIQKKPDERKLHVEWYRRYIRYRIHLTEKETTKQDDLEDNPGETGKVGDHNVNLASDPEENKVNTDKVELTWEIIGTNEIGLWNTTGE